MRGAGIPAVVAMEAERRAAVGMEAARRAGEAVRWVGAVAKVGELGSTE